MCKCDGVRGNKQQLLQFLLLCLCLPIRILLPRWSMAFFTRNDAVIISVEKSFFQRSTSIKFRLWQSTFVQRVVTINQPHPQKQHKIEIRRHEMNLLVFFLSPLSRALSSYHYYHTGMVLRLVIVKMLQDMFMFHSCFYSFPTTLLLKWLW